MAQDPGGKLPIPEETARRKAETLIREVLARDSATAKTSDQRTGFAKHLIKESEDLKDDAADYYVLLDIGHELAVQAGNVSLTLDVVRRLDDHFVIDAPAKQTETLQAVGKESRSSRTDDHC